MPKNKNEKNTGKSIKNWLANNDRKISEKKNEFWGCLEVVSGKELEVAQELIKKKVPIFIPLFRKGSNQAGYKPLISGYIFLRIPRTRIADITDFGIKYLETEGPLSYRNFIRQLKRLA